MKYESLPSSMTIWNICNSPCIKTINKKAKSQQNVFHKELNVETLLVTNKEMWKKWLSNADHRNDSQSIAMRFNSI